MVAAIAAGALALAPAAQADPLDLLPPIASITATPNPVAAGDLVAFDASGSFDIDGTITGYEWDLDGNGSFETDTGTQSFASSQYFSTGTVHVKVRVSDTGEPSPNRDEAQVNVDVKGPPHASFNISPAAPKTGDEITLTSTASDPDGSVQSEDWDLDNDGVFDDASGSTVKTSFSAGGTYQIRLLVADNDNYTAIATDTVTVSNRGPVAAFNFSPSSPQAGQTVSFNSSSSDPDGSLVSTDWDLDNDGEFDDASGSSAQWDFASPGSKTVRLQVIDDDNTIAVVSHTVSVTNRPPTAAFDVAPDSPISGETVVFTSTSNDPDGQALSYAWDTDGDDSFDDGTASSASRSFPTPGSKTVKLRVTDSGGASDIATVTFNVANRPPTASFTYSPATPLTAQPITFTSTSTDPDGTIASAATQWDFDNDGYFDKFGTSVQNTFAVPGSYVVTLLVTDSSGVSDIVQKTIVTENRPPTANFSFSPTTPQTGQTVTFSNSSSDPNGSIATSRWDFDGNGVVDSTVTSPTFVYAKPGTYAVNLEVVDNNGATNVVQKSITVSNRAPTAGFDTGPAAPQTNDLVTFSSTSTDPDGTVKVFQWDFGDGTKLNGENLAVVTHAFDTSGAKSVKLTVVDDLGRASTTLTKSVTINNRPPNADFIHTPAFPNPFETVTFNAATSGDTDGTIIKYEWDLDDDGTFDDDTADGTADKTATRKFTESGAFTIRLRVTDDKGAATATAQTVFVGNRPPVASFGFSPSQPVAGEPVTLYSTAGDPDSPITSYAWDLDGNGIYSEGTGTTITHAFPAGSYNVGLLVTDSEGASGFAIQTVKVSAPAPPARTVVSTRLMSPFPLVRIAGTISRRGSRLRRLTVTAPTGATVIVRCHGRSCPFGRQSRLVKASKKSNGRQPTVQAVRIRRFERKLLQAGTMIRIYVTKPGTIGKFASFKIRARQAPLRSDRCLALGSNQPINCPTS